MKLRLKSLLTILFFVLLYAAYYWGVPLVVNIQQRVPQIQDMAKKELGMDIELKDPQLKMGITPSVWLDASFFSVKDGKTSPLEIAKPKVEIELIPLLVGKVHITYFSCDKISANFKMDKNYRFYIGNSLIIRNSNSLLSIEDSQMDIGLYNIKLKDELQNKNILLDGDFLNLEKFNSKKYIKFQTNSTLNVDERSSLINADVDLKLPLKKGFDTNQIVFDGTITNLNLADLSPYIHILSKNKIVKTNGIINIQADTKAINRKTTQIKTDLAVNNLEIIGKTKQDSITFKNKLSINSIVEISKNVFEIKKLNMSSGKLHSSLLGTINKISSKNPNLNLVLTVNKSKIEDFVSLIPAVNFKNIDINFIALKKYGFYGDADGKLFIKGKISKPNLNGDFKLKNVYIIKPLNIPKATVNLKFKGNKLLLDAFVPINPGQVITVKGPMELFDKKTILLDIKSTPNVDLETTEFILNPLHEIFYFDLGPLPVMKLSGYGNISLKVGGNKIEPHLWGIFNFKKTKATIDGINMKLNDGEGSLKFNDKNTYFVTQKAFLDEKPIKIEGTYNLSGNLDFDINAKAQRLNKLIDMIQTSSRIKSLKPIIAPIKASSGFINFELKLKGKVLQVNDFEINKTVFASGNVKLLGNSLLLTDLKIPLKKLVGNLKFKNNDADFDLYSALDTTKLHIIGKIRDKKIYSKLRLNDIAFSYAGIPVKIYSGNLELKNDKLTLYRVNAALDSMPVLFDGLISDIFKNPRFDVYVNSKPSQRFIEKYINKKAIYPLKVKGDIIYSAIVRGTKEKFGAKAEINLQEDSNIYYMGSTLGDVNDPIRIYLDTTVSKNSIFVNNFQYDKLISSQNHREFISPQLNAKGQINYNNKDITLHNFVVKTQNPTDAKIFNILFKKPLIKQGLFSSNVLINNSITSPRILGQLNFTGIDIPLLDTTIKDISLDFTPKNIDIKTKGEIFSNKIVIFGNMLNKLTPPYVLSDVDIYLGNLDVNEIVKTVNKLELETDLHKAGESKQDVDITNLIIKNAKLKADSIFVKNIFANNLTAEFSLNDRLLFSLNNFKFDVAQGQVEGNFSYNLLNSKSSLDLNVDKVNANQMTEALFDLPNQIFGSLTGQVNLTCNGKTHKTCMDTLTGTGGFRVQEGKMPKLGSLEYLLKAANLVKSGVTGLTINSVIELLTPLKTGQFENINGTFTIDSGVANPVQIFSKGKDLSVFVTGKYTFPTLIADMEVFGRISKKFSNLLGPVGNTSINTLFNTIPGLNLDENNKAEFIKKISKIPGFELNDKKYRVFSSEIYGDINGENYVKSFRWVE